MGGVEIINKHAWATMAKKEVAQPLERFGRSGLLNEIFKWSNIFQQGNLYINLLGISYIFNPSNLLLSLSPTMTNNLIFGIFELEHL